MAEGVHRITAEFEELLCKYTGAKYAVTVDNQSNGLFLSLLYEGIKGKEITIPSRTYPSVPCEILHAGGFVKFSPIEGKTLKGPYQLSPTRVWDSALRFTNNMYLPGSFMCLSFTGPYKHLKLSKGGAILTDDHEAYLWFKRMRFSGRRECSYHTDNLDMVGFNFYMMPELAARGILMMSQFYDMEGNPKSNEDLEIAYPDLSKFPVYTHKERNSNMERSNASPEFFDQVWEKGSYRNGSTCQRLVPFLKRFIPDGCTINDYGSGTGRAEIQLLKYRHKINMVDFSSAALETATRILISDNLTYTISPLESLPVDFLVADWGICINVLMTCDPSKLDQIMKEMRRTCHNLIIENYDASDFRLGREMTLIKGNLEFWQKEMQKYWRITEPFISPESKGRYIVIGRS
jgi:SAM-dependent methyltransferase